MKEEIVNGVLDKISLGNQNMRSVLGMIYAAGKECIDVWPEDKTGLMSRRMLRITGILIRQRINPEEVGLMGKGYWQSEEGKKVDLALATFIETRKNRRMEGKEKTEQES